MLDPRDEMLLDAAKLEAERMLASLNLTPDEATFARDHGAGIFYLVTKEFVKERQQSATHLRALAVAGAVANALIGVQAWAQHVDKPKE